MLINIQAPEKNKVANLKATDPWLAALMTASYSEVDTFVDNQINTLTDAKKLFKLILKVLVFIIRKHT
jgi:hypothetical protein